MIEKPVPTSKEQMMMQHHTIYDVIARDHVDLLRREARQARLAAKARRHSTRSSHRSR
jgi:hypothetical protein